MSQRYESERRYTACPTPFPTHVLGIAPRAPIQEHEWEMSGSAEPRLDPDSLQPSERSELRDSMEHFAAQLIEINASLNSDYE